jgi:hypothetical protein
MKKCKKNLHEYEGKFCKECRKIWKYNNRDLISIKNKEWSLRNKEKLLFKKKEYLSKNRETILIKKRKHYQENKEKAKQYQKIHQRKKRKVCISFRLQRNLRNRLWSVLRNRVKKGSAVKDLGCTPEELKLHLESKFLPGMSWDNYGRNPDNWSIDHIIPLSSVNLENREEFLKVNNYTNLQPMWHIDNMRKGNKIHTEELNKYY